METRLEMTAKRCDILTRIFTGAAVCASLVTATLPARAQGCGRDCGGEIVGIGIGIAAGGPALGIGVFYAIHHGHSINGCALSGPDGLELQNRGDQQTYALIGQVADIKPGDRVRVSGKKEKKKAGAPQQFLVEKLSRDFGACTAPPATP
jgi:hypothetical protein